MKLPSTFYLATLVAYAYSAAIESKRLEQKSLSVTLNQSKSLLTGSIKNTGTMVLNLLNKGTIIDGDHAQILQNLVVYSGDVEARFTGQRSDLDLTNLEEFDFTILEPGQIIEWRIDPAQYYDLSQTGDYSIVAKGTIPLADSSIMAIASDVISYESNEYIFKKDRQAAGLTRRAGSPDPSKSISVSWAPECDDPGIGKPGAIKYIFAACAHMAKKAANEAREEPTSSRFFLMFGRDDQEFRNQVADRFDAIANSCMAGAIAKSGNRDASLYVYCQTPTMNSACENRPGLAYYEDKPYGIVICPSLFDYPLDGECWGKGRADLLLHEFSHIPGVISPRTQDHAYLLENIVELPSEKAYVNADSYRLYAQAVLLDCKG